MSLKTFHIIFVGITTLLCLFVAVWGFVLAPPAMAESAKTIGYLGVIGAIIMPTYGISFYRKVKKLSTVLES